MSPPPNDKGNIKYMVVFVKNSRYLYIPIYLYSGRLYMKGVTTTCKCIFLNFNHFVKRSHLDVCSLKKMHTTL